MLHSGQIFLTDIIFNDATWCDSLPPGPVCDLVSWPISCSTPTLPRRSFSSGASCLAAALAGVTKGEGGGLARLVLLLWAGFSLGLEVTSGPQ